MSGPMLSGTALTALLVVGLSAFAAEAGERHGLSPPPTLPLSAPELPLRPDGLKSAEPAGAPASLAPLPPERPPELTDKAAPTETDLGGFAPKADEARTPSGPIEAPAPLLPTASPSVPAPPERPPEFADKTLPPSKPDSLLLDAPQPPARPAELGGSAPLQLTIPAPETPLPPERPVELGNRTAPVVTPDVAVATHPGEMTIAPVPPARPPEMEGKTTPAPALEVPEDTACLRRLDALGVKYEKLPPIVNGQCSVAHPLDLKTIGDGVGMNSVAVTADQMIVCGVAEGLGRWAQDAQAAAAKELGDRLKGLTLGGGYHCRGQNNVGEARLSEHAFANAMDIMGFTFAKHAPILVGFLPADSAEAKFLDSVRASACKYFTTVLGPGSNEAHANHLHFDQRERGGSHRICELGPPPEPATTAQNNTKR